MFGPSLATRAYVYARASGIIANSFLMSKSSALNAVSKQSELVNLVFPDTSYSDTAGENTLEARIMERTVEVIVSLMSNYKKRSAFLVRLLRSYEFADLKLALQAYIAGEKAAPANTDLRGFCTVTFSAYPDLPKMLETSEFGFLLERNLQFGMLSDLTPLFDELDFLYYTKLWDSLSQEKASDVKSIRKILAEEIALSNCSRALRLRTYYNYQPSEIRPYLIDIKTQKHGRSTAADALASLTLELDHLADWSDWRRRRFLPREVPGAFWKADPRYFQSAAAIHLFNMARISFRSNPFALDTLALFIKLKQFEEQILCAISEAARQGMTGADVLSIMGVSA